MSTILDRIIAAKRQEIEQARVRTPPAELERRAADAPPPRDFRAALERGPGVGVIAEVKKASPSAGVLKADFDPAAVARLYEQNGAACVSVLTDGPFFQGSLADLAAVRAAVGLPILRKDFILDRIQLLEARAAGADAVLLIAEVLDDATLSRLLREARELGLQALVELYDRENLPRVLDAGARLVGVNNRDLRTFVTRLERTLDLAAKMPADVCLVSESGIRTAADVGRLRAAGVRAVLVGETLMRAADPAAKLRELCGSDGIRISTLAPVPSRRDAMHEAFTPVAATPVADDGPQRPWYRLLTSYHWFVLLVAALGWLFDCMDQQLFILARPSALKALLPPAWSEDFYAGLVTAVFIAGWATGGLIFGVLGDRIGRARVMMWTILIYSACTGLTAFSVGVWDFALYRFLTGLGVGGEFAVGVALVAEVMPDRARPFALALLQALSAVGNVSAALISMGLGRLAQGGQLAHIGAPWQLMFVVGTIPALLALLIRGRLKEPERWKHLAESGAPVRRGSMAELFSDPRWRRNALVGFVLACSGAIGLWAIGFFSYDLIGKILAGRGMAPGDVIYWKGVASLVQNGGSVLGVYFFSILTFYTGRRPAFALCFVGAILATAGTFWYLRGISDIYWMIPVMGFWQLSLFGGYAIYFPELFPTRLRSTGTSFCYNVGRYAVAVGVLFQGTLASWLAGFGGGDKAAPLRYAGVIMCAVFVFGLLALPFAPETKGRPLPE